MTTKMVHYQTQKMAGIVVVVAAAAADFQTLLIAIALLPMIDQIQYFAGNVVTVVVGRIQRMTAVVVAGAALPCYLHHRVLQTHLLHRHR